MYANNQDTLYQPTMPIHVDYCLVRILLLIQYMASSGFAESHWYASVSIYIFDKDVCGESKDFCATDIMSLSKTSLQKKSMTKSVDVFAKTLCLWCRRLCYRVPIIYSEGGQQIIMYVDLHFSQWQSLNISFLCPLGTSWEYTSMEKVQTLNCIWRLIMEYMEAFQIMWMVFLNISSGMVRVPFIHSLKRSWLWMLHFFIDDFKKCIFQ